MKRLVSAAMLLLLLNACASLPFGPYLNGSASQSVEQETFMSALEQFSATGRVDSLRRFQHNYPDTEYAKYAASISRLTEKPRLQSENRQLQSENRQLKEQLDKLQQENAQLKEKLDLVKKLLIDLESQQQ